MDCSYAKRFILNSTRAAYMTFKITNYDGLQPIIDGQIERSKDRS